MKFTTKQLKYEDILQYVSEEDIALFYLGATTKSTMYSLFREEDNPGKYLFWYNGRMRYNDWIVKLSLPDAIMAKNNWSYAEFMEDLLKNFHQTKATIPQTKIRRNLPPKTKHTEIKIKAREWQDYDLEFWGKGGITLDWLKDPRRNIKPLKYFWVNNFINVAEKYSYSYEYYWHEDLFRRKLYQPYSTDRKWVSNIDPTVVQNINTLDKSSGNELLIISSSYKDTGVIECNLLLPENRKYIPSCAPNNESVALPEQLPYKFSQRFKRIITWFDQDFAGRNAAKKYQQLYGYEPIFIPEYFKKNYNIKDPFEFRSRFGKGEFVRLSNYLLKL